MLRIQTRFPNGMFDCEFAIDMCQFSVVFLFAFQLAGYFDVNHFWQWSSFKDYLYIIVVFVAVMGTLTYIFVDSVVFVEGMGLLSLLLEAMLGLPQFLRNWRSKSTAGMSFGMVLSWFAGDTFKISYFVLRNAPLQFHVCGALQLCMDMALLLQVFAFRKTRTHTQKTFIENL
eukprot:m.53077 g.53077  ORF g.53077 m.53077 type:complete len:173 (+) comp11027_c0_seq4:116-634(+)